jgi:homoserine O-acetyltransferase/O-succinyltransferase
MTKHEQVFHFSNEFPLEGGGRLKGFDLKYTTVGSLNRERNNVVWVCHALTGSSDFTSWWGDLFTTDSPLNPGKNFIICANMLGSCYGSTGALSINAETQKNFFHTFPAITNRDTVRAFDLLRESLGISSIHTLIGGSLGGQQVLEWAIMKPSLFEHVIPIACNASHSPWGIAFNEAQRMAIAADPTWKENDFRAGNEGLKAARAIGMISYRTYQTFQHTQAEKSDSVTDSFRAATYQQYQGEKLANRFNAFAYWTLSKMMDSHNVARNRESVEAALQHISARTLVVGIESDLLFPLQEQQSLAANIPGAQLAVIQSLYGHDGFLVEYPSLKKVLQKFYTTTEVLL